MTFSSTLSGGNGDSINDLWNQTAAAGDFEPLPRGVYIAHAISGELVNSRSNATPGYEITFRVAEGDFVGRRFWHPVWFTKKATPMAKRDLAKIGITDPTMMEQELRQGIRCRCKLTIRVDDQGRERNKVDSFEFVGHDDPIVDDFALEVEHLDEPEGGKE